MTKKSTQCELGLIGLGVMGRNLLLNMADQGFKVAGYDKDANQVKAFEAAAGEREVCAADNLPEFLGCLRKPRSVMILVPAGDPVDSVLEELRSPLDKNDLVIDGGNSYFEDTERRQRSLSRKGMHLLGVGISGGEAGARHGPSMMPGGSKEGYDRVSRLLEACSAKVKEEPCVTYLGPRGAGHFVKMVHNGIEYGVMELLAETYHLLTRGLGFETAQLHDVYQEWNQGLDSFLVEITAHICARMDEKTGRPLVEMIRDVARQKGTGIWTSQSAMELQVPVPTIDMGVGVRHLSVFEEEREKASHALHGPDAQFQGDRKEFLRQLQRAFQAALVLTYAQGFALLEVASRELKYELNLRNVARIWRGGCIIRAGLLEDISAAYTAQADLPNLLLSEGLGRHVYERQSDLRRVVCAGVELGVPMPGLMTALGYFDGYRSAWLPANLIQAQRDYFGSHTYERWDAKGKQHTEWGEE